LRPEDLAAVVLSALLHAVWSVSIKGSTSPLGFNLLQLAPPVAAACALPWLVPLADIPPSVWALAAATALAHGLYFYWLSRALEVGDLSVVYPIARSAPAFLPLVAVPLLGDRVTALGVAGIAIVVAGMWAVQLEAGGGRLPRFSAPGAGFAWLTLAASVGYSLSDKAAMARLAGVAWHAPIPRAVFWYLLLCAGGSLVFGPLALRRLPRGALPALARRELRMALVAAAVGLAGYGLILHAFRVAPVSYVVAVRQSSVVFALGLGAIRLRERPSRVRVLGALATVAGVVLVAVS
jgi:uncharacterized membrane protein